MATRSNASSSASTSDTDPSSRECYQNCVTAWPQFQGEEHIDYIKTLLRRATQDYVSVETWAQYLT